MPPIARSRSTLSRRRRVSLCSFSLRISGFFIVSPFAGAPTGLGALQCTCGPPKERAGGPAEWGSHAGLVPGVRTRPRAPIRSRWNRPTSGRNPRYHVSASP
jgi:hypothetical protein